MSDISNLEAITTEPPRSSLERRLEAEFGDGGSTEETSRHGSEGIAKATTGGRGKGRSKVRLIHRKVFNGMSVLQFNFIQA